MKFTILDQFSQSGTQGKVNDDWLGHNSKVAIVADGATGLGEARLVSDAASDAQFMSKSLCEHAIEKDCNSDINQLVLNVIQSAKCKVSKHAPLSDIPRYAWPACSFIMARLQGDSIEISSLGDCGAYVRFKDDSVKAYSAMALDKEAELISAANDLSIASRSGEAIRSPKVIASLRRKRELHNSDASGIWTVGLVEDAATRVFVAQVPADKISEILLMSDGFSTLCEVYEHCNRSGLLRQASTLGLAKLNDEIRKIEREIDPNALKFPRYKQSDDSTAILLKLD